MLATESSRSLAVPTIFERTALAIRSSLRPPVPKAVSPEDRLLVDLGFDSLSLATLTLTLEEEFGRTILLDAWIAANPDLEDLTAGSLAEHVRDVLEGGHGGH
jgi:acyl carrier protein